MRFIILTILLSLILCLPAGAFLYNSHDHFPLTDTLPPPPPPGPLEAISGPSSACTGDLCEYFIEVPVACSCQWSVDGTPQSGSGSELTITWTQPGIHTVAVVFNCNGELSEPEIITVSVAETPQPTPISGDELVCEYTYHTYSTIVGENDSCQWTVNGEIQPGYSSSIEYAFGASGNYHFEVIAYNACGTSSAQILDVTAQGTAPAPPSPIQGPGQSCIGNTDIFTTTVGQGESCAWSVDGILQSSTTTTLEVTWNDWGEHVVEARAVSDCGTGNPALKNVSVRYQPIVSLGNDTVIVQGQNLLLDAGNPGLEYLWSTGETTQAITVSLAGEYSVNVSGPCGSDSDTIEIDVAIGIMEPSGPKDCFTLTTCQRTIEISNLENNVEKIQVYTAQGSLVYEGKPSQDIAVGNAGIYFIRVFSPGGACFKKVFIP